MRHYYITFRSVTFAQRGEQVLRGAGYHCTLLRTPKWMEAQGCGYSLRIWTDDIAGAVAAARKERVLMRKVYAQQADGTLEELAL